MTTPAPQQGTSSPTINPACHMATGTPAVRRVGSSNASGAAGFVLGVMAAVFFWVPFLGYPLGAFAVAFGCLGMAAATRGEATNRTVAAWGVGLGIFALAFWPMFIIIAAIVTL